SRDWSSDVCSSDLYTSQDALSRSQETGRLATEFLSRDIRMAGYVGCVSGNPGVITNTLNTPSAFLYDFDTAVQGFDYDNEGGSTTLPAGAPTPKAGTDSLVIRGAFGSGVQITTNNVGAQLFVENLSTDTNACKDPNSGAITTGYSSLCNKDILVVSDCSKARVFQASNVQASGGVNVNVVHSGANMTPGNAISSWGGASAPDDERFGADSEVIKMSTVSYYVAVSGTTNRSGLYQRVNANTSVELLEGVEDMQVLYGRDTNGDDVPDVYQTATAITAAAAWADVQSVRVQLLVQSIDDNVVPDPQPNTFNGEDVTPTDRRLRHVFVSTTGIRSRLK